MNPIEEIDPESRETMWRAAAEAREKGSAMCTAQVRLTGRWFEGVMRYIGSSTRGDIFSLNICRSGDLGEGERSIAQAMQNTDWSLDMLSKIVPNGLVKCEATSDMTIDYMSPRLVEASGLSGEEFLRRFHNSFIETVAVPDRSKFMAAAHDSATNGDLIDVEVRLYHGFGSLMRVGVLGRVNADSAGKRWLYLMLLLKGMAENDGSADALFDRTIPFDYYLEDDRLVIHAPLPDGTVRDMIICPTTSPRSALRKCLPP